MRSVPLARTRATAAVKPLPAVPRVLLVSMPFVSISTPSIGISILKSVLDGHGIPCDLRYANLRFAEWVGFETYSVLDERVSDALFAGDWLFAQHLFGDRLELDVYAETLRVNTTKAEYTRIMEARSAVAPFLDACLDEFRIDDYDVIGFTTTFEQNLASLAASRLIKDRWPEKAIVFGGGNCEGEMGRELHRSFPWIDYVCSGEGEHSFPLLIEAIAAGREPVGIPGIIHRRHGGSVDNGAAQPITDMNAVPPPNYDEYFAAIGRSPVGPSVHPALLIETSRGCWWGAKAHCTFCGLNGATMNFRSKDASRVLDELEGFRSRYPTTRVVAVDNILDMRYFRDVLPQLRDRQLGLSLFYETKANLSKEQVKLLRDAGVLAIQPGVESLSTHVLQLMRKGVSALQNIQLLKWCKQYGVTVAWNLLYGFPGETAADYVSISRTLESLWHLPPPHSVGAVRMDRFSPYFNQAATFGLVNVRPMEMYRLLYPLPQERLRNLAYFFEFDHPDGRAPAAYLGDIEPKVDQWRKAGACSLTAVRGTSAQLVVTDTRPNAVHRRVVMNGVQREVYELCDGRRRLQGIVRSIAERYAVDGAFELWLRDFLAQMVEWRLMVNEEDEYLSLAVQQGPGFEGEPVH
jgi:ribosomal peptide maturation radical SAM protein 1